MVFYIDDIETKIYPIDYNYSNQNNPHANSYWKSI